MSVLYSKIILFFSLEGHSSILYFILQETSYMLVCVGVGGIIFKCFIYLSKLKIATATSISKNDLEV